MAGVSINSRSGAKISLLVDRAEPQIGLVFVAHGLGGFKEQRAISGLAAELGKAGYTTVRWDARDTIGESEGKLENATIGSYYEDLEDVIKWAASQTWFQKPFVLYGHSLGATISVLFAERNPKDVLTIIPAGVMVSGQTYVDNHDPKELAEWKARGVREKPSFERPSVIKRVSWHFVEDSLKYDLLPEAGKLTMPALFITGELDEGSTVTHNQSLLDAMPHGRKELHVVPGSGHNFRTPEHIRDQTDAVLAWLKKLHANV